MITERAAKWLRDTPTARWIILGLVAYIAETALARTLSSNLRAKLTALPDLERLAERPRRRHKLRGTAVICGGSIAGLLAARVCSDHFEHVVVVEAETWTTLPFERDGGAVSDNQNGDAGAHGEDGDSRRAAPALKPNPRKRVPQYTSAHSTQVFNLDALKRLFPDFEKRLVEAGVVVGPGEFNICIDGVSITAPHEYYPQGLPRIFAATREAYETVLRRAVRDYCPDVQFIAGTVTGIERSSMSGDVTAVVYRPPDGIGTVCLACLLVADCTGPASAGYRWLRRGSDSSSSGDEGERSDGRASESDSGAIKLGYNPHIRYTTVEFLVDPESMRKVWGEDFDATPWLLAAYSDNMMDDRLFASCRVEKSKILVVAGSADESSRVRSVQDIRDYASSLRLRGPLPRRFWSLLDYLETGPERTAKYADCIVPVMHYIKHHKMKNLPRNFVALGDAVMRVNPFFGQGWSKAMSSALILNSHLLDVPAKGLLVDFSTRFFRAQHSKLGHVWVSTKSADYGRATTTPVQGETLSAGSFSRWYARQIGLICKTDPEIGLRLWRVVHWLEPPTILMAPSVVLRVVWHWFTTTRHLDYTDARKAE